MTKEQALHAFWDSFGWPAVNEQSDIDEATAKELGMDVRRIEYEVRTGDYDQPVALMASLYHRSTSWTEINDKAKQIREFIGSGYRIPIDGGYLWIAANNPFSSDATTADIGWRRIILNINANFLTNI